MSYKQQAMRTENGEKRQKERLERCVTNYWTLEKYFERRAELGGNIFAHMVILENGADSEEDRTACRSPEENYRALPSEVKDAYDADSVLDLVDRTLNSIKEGRKESRGRLTRTFQHDISYNIIVESQKPSGYQANANQEMHDENARNEPLFVTSLWIEDTKNRTFEEKYRMIKELSGEIKNNLAQKEIERLKGIYRERFGEGIQYGIFSKLLEEPYFLEGFSQDNNKRYNFAVNPSLKPGEVRLDRPGEAEKFYEKVHAVFQAYKSDPSVSQKNKKAYMLKKIEKALLSRPTGVTADSLDTLADWCHENNVVLKFDSEKLDLLVNGGMSVKIYGTEDQIKKHTEKVMYKLFGLDKHLSYSPN